METDLKECHKLQQDYFDKKAETYESGWLLKRSLDGGYERKAKIVKRELGAFLERPLNVLEVGAGTGLFTYWLQKCINISKYLGIDISEEMLKVARSRFLQNNNITFERLDASELNSLTDESFELVLGSDIIHHISNPVPALSEWLRVTKKGGRLVVLEGNIYHPVPLYFHIGDESESRFYLNTDYNLRRWLIESGWKDVQVLPAPIFTPWKPRFLRPLYRLLDVTLVKVPYLNKLTAVWVITAQKSE